VACLDEPARVDHTSQRRRRIGKRKEKRKKEKEKRRKINKKEDHLNRDWNLQSRNPECNVASSHYHTASLMTP